MTTMQQNKEIKTADFLSQIPNWEADYKDSSENEINYTQDEWIKAEAIYSENSLTILGKAVMEDWETPYMRMLAEIATMNGGTVLEIGFGMGISAGFIKMHNIDKHIIIEANKQVAQKARQFAEHAPAHTEVIEGLWQDVIDVIPDNTINGILFDSYPLTEEELYQAHFFFFSSAFKKLNDGGVLTYYSSDISNFSKVHETKLTEAGFKRHNIKGRVCSVTPPPDCEYWKAKTILAPVVIK